jgi:hypothetical protein
MEEMDELIKLFFAGLTLSHCRCETSRGSDILSRRVESNGPDLQNDSEDCIKHVKEPFNNVAKLTF